MKTEQLITCKCCEPLQKIRVRLGACKIDLSSTVIYITDRSKPLLLWWFYLFYVLELNICAV